LLPEVITTLRKFAAADIGKKDAFLWCILIKESLPKNVFQSIRTLRVDYAIRPRQDVEE
jgi:hypothetical protein